MWSGDSEKRESIRGQEGYDMELMKIIKGSDDLTPKQQKSREIIMYLICGGLTTVVNLLSFALFDYFVTAEYNVTIIKWEFDLLLLLNNTIAWILAVICAFITNRVLVFRSNGSIIKEFVAFTASRIATFLIFELGTFALFVMLCENVAGIPGETVMFSVFGFDVTYLFIIKLANAILVVIVNYILSKLFIFKRHKEGTENANT